MKEEERERKTSKTKEKEEMKVHTWQKYPSDANEENIPGAREERSPAKWQ